MLFLLVLDTRGAEKIIRQAHIGKAGTVMLPNPQNCHVCTFLSSQPHSSYSLVSSDDLALFVCNPDLCHSFTENSHLYPHSFLLCSDPYHTCQPLSPTKSLINLCLLSSVGLLCALLKPQLCKLLFGNCSWKETEVLEAHLTTFHSLGNHSLLSNAGKDFVQCIDVYRRADS